MITSLSIKVKDIECRIYGIKNILILIARLETIRIEILFSSLESTEEQK